MGSQRHRTTQRGHQGDVRALQAREREHARAEAATVRQGHIAKGDKVEPGQALMREHGAVTGTVRSVHKDGTYTVELLQRAGTTTIRTRDVTLLQKAEATPRAATSTTTPKVPAEVTLTHTLHAGTRSAQRWHEVAVTHPDGTQTHVSVNATVFPTKTGAKAEAIRRATGQPHDTSTIISQARPTYASEYTRLTGSTNQPIEGTTNHTTLARFAREAGRADLAALHEQLATTYHEDQAYRAALALQRGRSAATITTRGQAQAGLRKTTARLKDLQAQLTTARAGAAPTPPKAASTADARQYGLPGTGQRALSANELALAQGATRAYESILTRYQTGLAAWAPRHATTEAQRATVTAVQQEMARALDVVNAHARALEARPGATSIARDDQATRNRLISETPRTLATMRSTYARAALFNAWQQRLATALGGTPERWHMGTPWSVTMDELQREMKAARSATRPKKSA